MVIKALFDNCKNTIVILNKTDKAIKTDREQICKRGFADGDIIESGDPYGAGARGNRPPGEISIAEKFALGKIRSGDVFISNLRQRDSLVKAKAAVNLALEGLDMPFDLLYVDLEDALSALGEVAGMTVQEEIIENQVFSRFCVGK